jgi:hypothetical protein
MEPAFTERGMAVFLGQGYADRPLPTTSQPLGVRFGDQLALQAYELSAEHLEPGSKLEVTLQWQALDAPGTEYTVSLHLVGADGQRFAQRDELLLDGFYQPTLWPPGEDVVDRHVLDIPPDLPTGRYRLDLGLYLPQSPDILLNTDTGADRITVGYLTTAELETPAFETPSKADFGPIALDGYTMDCRPSDGVCQVGLYWRRQGEIEEDYTVFVHLIGSDGFMAGQHDGPPQAGFYPTSAWIEGEAVVDDHTLDLVDYVPAGNYELRVGLYLPDTAERLSVLGRDGEPVGDTHTLTTIHITP